MILKNKQSRKRIILVNRDFQLRYARAAVGVGILSTFLTTVVILYPLYTFEILKIPRFLPTPILMAMVFAAVINVFLIGVMGVFVTHKMAGPMYSMVRHFRKIGLGRYGEMMRLRDDDELKFVVRNFNEMIGNLAYRAESDSERLTRLLDELQTASNQEARDQATSELAALSQEFQQRAKLK